MKKQVSILEVAKKAGVSKSTASRAINNSYGVSVETRDKVMKAMDELKYRPNISARYLRSKRNNLFGILISKEDASYSISHLVNSQKISGIANKCSEKGFDVLIFIEDINDHKRLYSIIREKGLSGIILLDRTSVEVLESLRSYNIPFVLVNWFSPGYKHQCYVKTDLAKATELALSHLISKGYEDIGIINWEDNLMKEKVIENTFIKYMKDRGLRYNNCVWNTSALPPWSEVIDFIDRTKKRAYICFSYLTSMKIFEHCRASNILIPEDFALISYEFFTFYDYLHPRLTGIKQQAELMGEKAAEKLIALVNGEKDVNSELIEPELIVRETC